MICRVCTNPGDVPLTEKVINLNILTAIRMVANVWVSSNDCYPKFVCKDCLEELKIALAFKIKCESSDRKFRLSLPTCETFLATKSPPMVFHDFAHIIEQMHKKKSIKNKNSDPACFKTERVKKLHKLDIPKKKENENPAPEKYYKCKRCDLTFDSKEQLLKHRLEQNCMCPVCPLCGKVVSNLSRHQKIVHLRSEKFTCHVCGKVSYSSGALRNHLLVHSDKFQYSCHLCPYKGKQQSYLTIHMRIHTGERPYLCSECPAKFVNPSNLRKHQLTHSSKKFECNNCNKQFRLKKTLQDHYEAAHLNVRYRCSICGRDLWSRRKLLSHELRVHNREKHKLYEEVYKVVVNDEID